MTVFKTTNENEANQAGERVVRPSTQTKSEQSHKSPVKTKQGGLPPIQTKESKKPPKQTREGSLPAVQAKQSNVSGGLPAQLKSNMEAMGGVNLDGVKVHENSSEPAKQQAEAYAQGNDIHLSPGKSQHLAHEAWHVVQQKQGRVKATTQMKNGTQLNDDPALEREADVMGDKALQMKQAPETATGKTVTSKGNDISQRKVMQMKKHSINGEIDWGLLDSDDSHFTVDTSLDVVSNEGHRWYSEKPMAHQNIVTLDGDKLNNSEKGTIMVKSKVSSLIDQDLGAYKEDKGKTEFISSFTYERDSDDRIAVYTDQSTPPIKTKHAFEGGQANYNYVRRIVPDSTDKINHTTAFMSNEVTKSKTNTHVSTSQSHASYGFNAGGNIDINSSLTVKAAANGEEILMLLGTTKLFKGGIKALQKKLGKNKWLMELLDIDAWKELLSKQEIKMEVNPNIKMALGAEFGFKYNSDSYKTATEVATTRYTTGGWMAEEVNIFQIKQVPGKAKGAAFFEGENQTGLSDTEKAEIDSLMASARAQDMLDKVVRGEYMVKLTGHASSSASDKYNKGVAAKRIAAVRTYIQKNYREIAASGNFTTQNKGEHQADQAVISAGDRRVDITFVKR